ncbi:MAG TPA: class I SAM-dependent methyltransferase [Nitrososphaeraceae archaeon]|nr:class I SAM-dependent methyltransferase [Nitrososphaeraceae archaeon]
MYKLSYDPSEYWHERGKFYKKNFHYDDNKRLQEEFLIDYLNGITGSFKSVLELGCGFGRISQLLLTNYNNITEYLAVDISPDQVENAKSLLSSTKLPNQVNLDFLVSDIQSLKLDKEYDLVILSEVLLHILPSDIDTIIKKLMTLSKKHIINIDWYEDQSPKSQASHNFIHQYEALYKKYTEPSTTTIKRIPIKRKKFMGTLDTKQSIFHVILEKKPN